MEKTLKSLFEYNRFENNSRLSRLINEAEARYGSKLSDEDLSFVSAAGTTENLLNNKTL